MISIIIPFFNEEESLKPLYSELTDALSKQKDPYEIILVNDGSLDRSLAVCQKLEEEDERVQIVSLRKRFGKGEALASGIRKSKGEVIIFMDADLQDDPRDILQFMAKINEGYDVVNGVRNIRRDSMIIRIYSTMFNWFLKNFLHSPLTDMNCGFKALKKEIFTELTLYGNNFRFLPLAAYYRGFRVSEINVLNRQRKYGKSKFGVGKIFIGFIDTITAYFLYQFSEKPLHFFGSIGASFFGIGFITALYLSYERIFFSQLLYRRPALQFAILMIIVGIQIAMTGFIGELIVYLNKKSK